MRLIDADALLKVFKKYLNDMCTKNFVFDKIDNAPTIEPSGDLISRAEAIDAVQKVVIDNDVVRVLSALPSADSVKVAYICDGRKCDSDCSDCFRTLDIEHARDFKLLGDTYYQQESADKPQVNSAEWVAQKEREFEELNRPKENSKPQPYVPEASTERVVHCKDCIYSRQPEGEELFVCENRFGMSGWVREDEFCSSGSL